MVVISAVYAFYLGKEVMYVGSTKNLQRRLFKEHLNPKWKKHGPFGRWLHDGNLERVTMQILEQVHTKNKKVLVSREFHYKRTLPKQRFGKLDGLGLQSLDLQNEIRRDRALEKNKNNPEFKPRGPQNVPTTQKKKNIWPEDGNVTRSRRRKMAEPTNQRN